MYCTRLRRSINGCSRVLLRSISFSLAYYAAMPFQRARTDRMRSLISNRVRFLQSKKQRGRKYWRLEWAGECAARDRKALQATMINIANVIWNFFCVVYLYIYIFGAPLKNQRKTVRTGMQNHTPGFQMILDSQQRGRMNLFHSQLPINHFVELSASAILYFVLYSFAMNALNGDFLGMLRSLE